MKTWALLATFLAYKSVSAEPRLEIVNVYAPCDNMCGPLRTEADVKNCIEVMTESWRADCHNPTIQTVWGIEDGSFCSNELTGGSFQVMFPEVHDFVESIDEITGLILSVSSGYRMSDPKTCAGADVFAVARGDDPCTDHREIADYLGVDNADINIKAYGNYGGHVFPDGTLVTWEGEKCEIVRADGGQGIEVVLGLTLKPPADLYRDVQLTFNTDCSLECGKLNDLDSVEACLDQASHVPGCENAIFERTFGKVHTKGTDIPEPCLCVSWDEVFFDEGALIKKTPARDTEILDLLFKWSASESCGKPELVFAQICFGESFGDHKINATVDDTNPFHFMADEILDWKDLEIYHWLRVTFPNQTHGCTLTQEEGQDTIKLRTYFDFE